MIVVTAGRTNLVFAKALVARKHIRADKGARIDAFDSSDSKYSASGKYVLTKHKDTASIAANSDKKDNIKLKDTKVYGDAATPPKGSVDFQGKGTVGDIAWVDGGKTGGQPGKISSNFSYSFASVTEPWKKGTGAAPTGAKNNWDMSSVIYAPDAKIMMDGGGDTAGAIVGRCIHLKHTGSFHYDEAINSKALALDMWVVKSWIEN